MMNDQDTIYPVLLHGGAFVIALVALMVAIVGILWARASSLKAESVRNLWDDFTKNTKYPYDLQNNVADIAALLGELTTKEEEIEKRLENVDILNLENNASLALRFHQIHFQDPTRREIAIHEIGQLKAGGVALLYLEEAMRHPDAKVRAGAVMGLSNFVDFLAWHPHIKTLLLDKISNESDPDVRKAAYATLRKCYPKDQQVRQRMVEVQNDKNVEVANHARWYLRSEE